MPNNPTTNSNAGDMEGKRSSGDNIFVSKHEAADITFNDVSKVEATPETYAAIMARHKPNPLGPGYLRLYGLAAVVFLCSTMNGFDASLMASINALPNFTSYFGLPREGNASTGIIFAIFQVGLICGAFFVWMADWYGRKKQMFFGCLGVCAGSVINALSRNIPMLIGSRFVIAFFVTWAHTAAPLYLVEASPAAYRATIAGLYNTFYFVGSVLATSSVYACHEYLSDQGDLDWRIPLWLQLVCPGIVALVCLFFPESPRWLAACDRHEEAKAFFTRYHANGEENHPIVVFQMKEIVESLQDQPPPNGKELFNVVAFFESRSSRYRLMLNFAFSWFAQFSGNNIISYYLPIMLLGIGVDDTHLQLVLNIVYAVEGWIFAAIGSRLHDVIGRRHMLIGSTVGMLLSLTVVGGCAAGYVEYKNDTAPTVSIVFIFLFGAIFALGYTPMQPVYPAEVMNNKMRAKGMGVFKLTAGAAGFLNTFVGPIALSSIGYWFYFFFVFWDTFEAAFMYFFFVETKGLTLEELDDVFEAKNPRKESVAIKRRQRRLLKAQTGAAKL